MHHSINYYASNFFIFIFIFLSTTDIIITASADLFLAALLLQSTS